MEDTQTTIKRKPGRPTMNKELTELEQVWPETKQDSMIGRKARFVQVHDAFTPLQLAPIMSLSTIGTKACEKLVLAEKGVHAVYRGREFLVPYGNVSFLEFE